MEAIERTLLLDIEAKLLPPRFPPRLELPERDELPPDRPLLLPADRPPLLELRLAMDAAPFNRHHACAFNFCAQGCA